MLARQLFRKLFRVGQIVPCQLVDIIRLVRAGGVRAFGVSGQRRGGFKQNG